MTWNWRERNKILTKCGEYLWKKSIWTNQRPSLTMSLSVALNENAKRVKTLWTNADIRLNPVSLQEEKKSYLVLGSLTQTSHHGPMNWKVMQRKVRSHIASWRIKQPSNCTKLQLHALMTTTSKKKNWDLLENCQNSALKILLSNCSEMLVFGQNWLMGHSMVTKQSYTSSYLMDQSLWQTLDSFDFLHSSHKSIQTLWSRGKHCTTMQTGTVSGLWLCQRR